MDNTLEARASASPPAQLDDEAPRQLPPLPEEIIHHIIKLAYPPRSLTNGLQRRHFLHRILLVNKSWHRLAKRELYRHLWLEKDEEVSEMLASQTRDDQQLPTRSVTVAKGDLTITMLRRLLGASSGLRSFCYLSESWVSRRVGLQLLAELAPNIEEVVLGVVDILETKTETLAFPKLHRLAIRHILEDDEADPIFLSLALDAPELDTLQLRIPWRGTDVTELEQGLQTLASQVRVLSIADEQDDYLRRPPFSPTLWWSFITLKTLIVDKESSLLDILPHLLSSLQSLVIRPRAGRSLGFAELLSFLESSAPCLASLQELHLPPVHPECVPESIDEMTARRLKVTNWCAERGIQVVTAPFIPEHDFLGYLEEVLDL